MKPLRPAALAGAAVLVVGVGVVAATIVSHSHTLTERLADGTVVKLWYAGDAPAAVEAFRPPPPLVPPPLPSSGDVAIARPEPPPAGMRSFSVVSTLTGAVSCTRSVEYESRGDGRPPKIVTRASSGCGRREAPPANRAEAKTETDPPGLMAASLDGGSPQGRWR